MPQLLLKPSGFASLTILILTVNKEPGPLW